MRSRVLFITILLFSLGSRLLAQNMAASMFADRRAQQVGDIITILVMEYSQASSEATTSTQKDNDHGLLATGGAQAQAYSPMYGLRGNVSNGFRGDASVTREGRVRTKITANITERNSNGNLVIQGSRVVEVNGEKELTTITGTVRPQDISWNNTVYSYQVADAEISYKGKGVVNSGQKPGFLAKVLNWIF
jgi:flagellar L-ring protein precursor FlgH